MCANEEMPLVAKSLQLSFLIAPLSFYCLSTLDVAVMLQVNDQASVGISSLAFEAASSVSP